MTDQATNLARLGISVARLGSDLGRIAERRAIEALKAGEVRLLFVSPERLVNAVRRQFDELTRALDILHGTGRLQLLVFDEAHCI